jgi:hypothetical protein
MGTCSKDVGSEVGVVPATASTEKIEQLNDGAKYSRFFMPSVRSVDEGSFNEKNHSAQGVCKLAPFLYRGSSAWPFKYQIKSEGRK